jgi:hypothetical protein
MVKAILILALGIIIGHFGPIASARWTMHSSAKVLHASGKLIDTTSGLLK